MKRYLAILLSLLLICGLAFAEEAEDPDAITSATLHIDDNEWQLIYHRQIHGFRLQAYTRT